MKCPYLKSEDMCQCMIDGLSPDLRKNVEFQLIGEAKTNEDIIRDIAKKIEDYEKRKPGRRLVDNAFYADEIESEDEAEDYSGENCEEEENTEENDDGEKEEDINDVVNSIVQQIEELELIIRNYD